MSLISESTKIEDICSDLEMKIQLLIIAIHRGTECGRTKCSFLIIEGDLDYHETEIDFGSGMKSLTFELSQTRVYRQK